MADNLNDLVFDQMCDASFPVLDDLKDYFDKDHWGDQSLDDLGPKELQEEFFFDKNLSTRVYKAWKIREESK